MIFLAAWCAVHSLAEYHPSRGAGYVAQAGPASSAALVTAPPMLRTHRSWGGACAREQASVHAFDHAFDAVEVADAPRSALFIAVRCLIVIALVHRSDPQ